MGDPETTAGAWKERRILDKKISRNRERDDEVNKQLLFLGWTVIRFWGKDIIKNTDECVKVVEEVIFDNMIAQNSVPEYWPEEEK